MLREFGELLPTLRAVLIDERDLYLARHIRGAAGKRVVAVLGAAHIPGVRGHLEANRPIDLEPLNATPPSSPLWRVVGWGIPALIVAALIAIGWQKGAGVAGEKYYLLDLGQWHSQRHWRCRGAVPSPHRRRRLCGRPAHQSHASDRSRLRHGLCAGLSLPALGARTAQRRRRCPHGAAMVGQSLVAHFPGVYLCRASASMIGTWVGGVEIFSNLFS